MTVFSADWLAAREPHDARARNPVVLDTLVAAVASLRSISIVDLGCGTGSTVRAIGPRLPARQGITTAGADGAIVTALEKAAASGKDVLECAAVDADLQNAAVKGVL